MTIELNQIECAHCRAKVVSAFRHDFRTHICEALKEKYGERGFIAADGGSAYLRRVGNREDWIEASIWRDDVVRDESPDTA